jgi:arsenite methyltransferase
VGKDGSVVGVDMTEEQIATSKKYLEYHKTKFGYLKSNVEFHHGYIENLADLKIADNSFDIIV